MTLYPPTEDRSAAFETSVPLTFDDGVPRAAATLTTPSGRDVPMTVLVDLGAKSWLLIPEPFIDARGCSTRSRKASRPRSAPASAATPPIASAARRVSRSTGQPRSRQDGPIVGLSVGGTLPFGALRRPARRRLPRRLPRRVRLPCGAAADESRRARPAALRPQRTLPRRRRRPADAHRRASGPGGQPRRRGGARDRRRDRRRGRTTGGHARAVRCAQSAEGARFASDSIVFLRASTRHDTSVRLRDLL